MNTCFWITKISSREVHQYIRSFFDTAWGSSSCMSPQKATNTFSILAFLTYSYD